MFKYYIAIARPSHWFKNIFVIPGLVMVVFLTKASLADYWLNIIIGLASACLIASANYTINEWFDADFDSFHPLKKHRPSVLGKIKYHFVVLQYALLSALGLFLALGISDYFFYTSALFLLMGFFYNINPIRTKDKPYLDVLSESVNNPIRLLLGWFMISSAILPPSSLLIAYWMAGAFLMAVKRYAELRLISDRSIAALYRKSFSYYTESNLLVSIIFYAMTFAFFFGVFMVKYKIEFILTLPFYSVLFAWYFNIGMKTDSSAQRPEKLYQELGFSSYVILVVVITLAALFINLPMLNLLTSKIITNH